MRGSPDRRGVVSRGEGAQAHRRDPGEASWKACEKKLFGELLQQGGGSLTPPPPRTLTHCCWECKRVQPFREMICQFLIKFIHRITHSTSRYLPRRSKDTCPHKDLYRMFTAALFIIAED